MFILNLTVHSANSSSGSPHRSTRRPSDNRSITERLTGKEGPFDGVLVRPRKSSKDKLTPDELKELLAKIKAGKVKVKKNK